VTTLTAPLPRTPEIPKLDKKKSIIAGVITIVTLIIVFAGHPAEAGQLLPAWDARCRR
jgi:hypothetical protein